MQQQTRGVELGFPAQHIWHDQRNYKQRSGVETIYEKAPKIRIFTASRLHLQHPSIAHVTMLCISQIHPVKKPYERRKHQSSEQ
jgi:hypothetical protein